jgi:hypothetical protein
MSLFSGALRQMRQALATAPDSSLGRIVGLLDALPDRGGADQLLAEARPRLRRLRPPRPLRFTRLLALPLEGALVAPAAWARNPFEVPRHALAPVAEAVRAGLGPDAADLDALAEGRTMADRELVGQLGGRLWRQAGALRLAPPLPGWAEAGLPEEAVAPILALCAGLWRHGSALWEARLAAPEGPSEPMLRATLAPIAPEGAAALRAATTLLLQHAAAPARVVWVAGGLLPTLSTPLEQALAEVLEGHAAVLGGAITPGDLADAATRLGERLAEVEALDAPTRREARRRQVARLRREGAEACQARLVAGLRSELTDVAAQVAAGTRADDAVVARLEETARDLRRLAAAGRRLGQDAAFDAAIAEAIPRLLALGAQPRGLGRVELARLVEILAGPEAALPLIPA